MELIIGLAVVGLFIYLVRGRKSAEEKAKELETWVISLGGPGVQKTLFVHFPEMTMRSLTKDTTSGRELVTTWRVRRINDARWEFKITEEGRQAEIKVLRDILEEIGGNKSEEAAAMRGAALDKIAYHERPESKEWELLDEPSIEPAYQRYILHR